MDFSWISKYYMYFIDGTKITIIIALFTVVFGIIIGLGLAVMKLSRNKLLSFFATAYIEFIRGTPLLVQLFIFYYGVPQLLPINITAYPAGIIALSLNSGAYVAEIIRAGIQAVDKGQMEAARTLGMSNGMAMKEVIIPQAFKNILPALGNEFVVVIKESSLVSVIGLSELMRASDIVRAATYISMEPLLVVAVIYFVLTFTASKFIGKLERRMKASD